MKVRATIVYILGMILIISSLVYIGNAVQKAWSFAPQDTVVIMPVRHDSVYLFNPARVVDWSNAYDGLVITERLSVQLVVSQTDAGFAMISAVGTDYFQVVYLPLISGSFLIAGDDYGIVLCKNIAWTLFGAIDVVGHAVQINDIYYTVVGVVDAVVESDAFSGRNVASGGNATANGFAWILCDGSASAGILYLRPSNYNQLSARLDAERTLEFLGHRYNDFIITDGNAYSDSIVLRGQILLVFLLVIFIFASVRWLIRQFRQQDRGTVHLSLRQGDGSSVFARQGDGSSVLLVVAAVFFSLLTAAVIFFCIWSISSIDLWLPAYMGEGISGYSRLIFNTGQLAPRAYLSAPLVVLWDMNVKANIAFVVAMTGVIIIGVTRFTRQQDR